MSDALEELQRLHAAATGGEWRLVNFGWTIEPGIDWTGRIQVGDNRDSPSPYAGSASFHAIPKKADAEFMVAAHNLLPELLQELREWREFAKMKVDKHRRRNSRQVPIPITDGVG